MAKRSRTSRSTHRPGGHGPNRSRRDPAALPPATETPPPVAPGAGLEARAETFDGGAEEFGVDYTEITIDESPPQAVAPVSRRRASRRTKVRSDDLEARVAAESVLARDDLRRIGLISVVLLAGLALAWVLFVLLDVFQLY